MARLINIANRVGRLDSANFTVLSSRKKTKEEMEQEEIDNQGEVYVSAVLSHNQYNMVKNGEAILEVPNGVTMSNKAGSRVLNFHCEDLVIAKELVEGLDVSGIPWQEDFEIEEMGI